MAITDDIRTSAADVAAKARSVRVDGPALDALAARLKDVPTPAWDDDVHWHDGGVRALMYLLVLDATNFCFWPSRYLSVLHGTTYGEDDGYPALAAALTRAFEAEVPLWDPSYLRTVAYRDFAALFDGDGELPLMPARHRNVRELGATLERSYGASAERLMERAGGDATALVRELASNFACFDDRRTYDGVEVPVFKRAQLCVSDIAGAFNGRGIGELSKLDELTCFADYKLPQLFRSTGVFVYEDGLDRRIASGDEIPSNAPEEVEIRCATIDAVERLKGRLAAAGRTVTSRELDWMLWNRSVEPGAVTVPFHRTRTTSY